MLAASPIGATPAAAQQPNGGWCTALLHGGGACLSDPMAACQAQWQSYAPNQTFEGYSDSSNWSVKNCRWSTQLGVILPANVFFTCNGGYTAQAPGTCQKNNADFQLRDVDCNCGDANNTASPTPKTGRPIDILTGSKLFRVTDFSTADGSLKLERFYASIEYGGIPWIMTKVPAAIAGNWRFSFQRELQFDSGGWLNGGYYLELETADGGSFAFSANGSNGALSPYQPNYSTAQTDYSAAFVGTWPSNPNALMNQSTQWTVHDPDDTVWLFQTYLNPISGHYDIAHPISITFRGGLTWTLSYGPYNQLTSLTDSYGKTITFTWTIWDPSGLGLSDPLAPVGISSVSLPDGTSLKYVWQSMETILSTQRPRADILTSVQHLSASGAITDSTSYLYENIGYPTFITGVVDNAGVRRWTVAYDTDGRATTSEEPSGIYNTTVAYTDPGYPTFTRTVTNALGKQLVYTYHWEYGDIHLQEIDGSASANTPASTRTYNYTLNFRSTPFLVSMTDEEGRVTSYSRNGLGQPTQIVDGSGTPSARTTSITWDSNFRVPDQVVQPNLTTNFTWNSSAQLTQVQQVDTTSQTVPYSTNGQSRAWSYTYDSAGHLLTTTGPLGPGQTVTYTYNSAGYLSTITNELGQVLTVSSVNGRGQPTTVVDENGVTTNLAYDSEARLTTITVNPGNNQAVTNITYDVVGDITQITRPNGAYLQYTWDNAKRLTSVKDNLGNSIQYTRNNLDGITARTIKDPTNALQFSQTATYDEIGRLLTFVGSASQTWTAAYDRTDNPVSITDPRSNIFHLAFDSVDRLISETNEDNSVVTVTRNGKDEITNYSDPRSLNTSYVRDGFGGVIQRSSPDTGVTVYTNNALGKPTQITDGRGVVTNLAYDNAGRLLTKQYPASTGENITIVWDSTAGGNFGVGRITEIDDASGSIHYTYNVLGQVIQERKTTAGVVYTIGYVYDPDGNVTQITYPSGRIVSYSRDTTGRISGVTTQQNSTSSPVTLATNVSYQPFGPLQSLWYGNGLDIWKVFTQDYLINCLYVSDTSTNPTTNYVSRCYGRSDNINITDIWDNLNSSKTQSLWYTPSNRLQNASGIWGASTFYYDGVGNRTHDIETAGTTTTNIYGYPSNNNQVVDVTQGSTTVRSFGYDGAGNIIADTRGNTAYNYIYNNRGRLAELDIGSTVTADYTYDGLERLAIRTTQNMTPSGTTQYVYDRAGHLIAESDGSGNSLTEYVWFDDMPLAIVANVDTSSPNLYFVHVDDLDRPIMMTDMSKTVVWQADYTPFGSVFSITGSATNNLRFPGQYFLIEDGLDYNWYRHYDETLGRYIQADPLGFIDGASLYEYVGSAPTETSDQTGLTTIIIVWNPAGYGKSSFGHVSIDIDDQNFSFAPNGWDTSSSSATDYNQRNMSFRSGTGFLLNLTPREEKDLKACLAASNQPYNHLTNNCTNPVQRCLPSRVHIPANRILPKFFASDLAQSPALITTMPFPQGP